jgi:hypothetical protein
MLRRIALQIKVHLCDTHLHASILSRSGYVGERFFSTPRFLRHVRNFIRLWARPKRNDEQPKRP